MTNLHGPRAVEQPQVFNARLIMKVLKLTKVIEPGYDQGLLVHQQSVRYMQGNMNPTTPPQTEERKNSAGYEKVLAGVLNQCRLLGLYRP